MGLCGELSVPSTSLETVMEAELLLSREFELVIGALFEESVEVVFPIAAFTFSTSNPRKITDCLPLLGKLLFGTCVPSASLSL